MTRAARITALAAVTLAGCAAAAPAASAQVVAYRHRSTVFGDHAAGAAELVRARGAFLRDQAAAARDWVDVAAASDQYWYQRAEYHYQVKQMRLNYLKQKAADNRERQQIDAAADEAAARKLLQSAQLGVPMWPDALKQSKFAGSMALVESLLKNWSSDGSAAEFTRRALATEAGVLRTRIASDATIGYNDRLEAVQTLQRLQLLAGMTPQAIGVGAQLAAR